MFDFAQARRSMVDGQLRTFDITDRAILGVMENLPRERFVAPGSEPLAYTDLPVSAGRIEGGERMMLAPATLGRLVQALAIMPGERALDVACGSGYGAALLSRLGTRVTAIESDAAMADRAGQVLSELGLGTVETLVAPLTAGPSGDESFDIILVEGGVAERPEGLLARLAEGGRLACVEGAGRPGRAALYLRSGDSFSRRELFDANAPHLREFVPEPGFVF